MTENLLPYERIKREVLVKKEIESSDKFGEDPNNRPIEKHLDFDDPLSTWMIENKSAIIVNDSGTDERFKGSSYAGASCIAAPFFRSRL